MKIIKTTIEIDNDKLERIMALTGLKTMKEAVDWALTEAVRIATINDIAAHPIEASVLREAYDPNYDVMEIRKQEVVNYKAAIKADNKRRRAKA